MMMINMEAWCSWLRHTELKIQYIRNIVSSILTASTRIKAYVCGHMGDENLLHANRK